MRGYDLTSSLHALIGHLTLVVPGLSHIDHHRLLVGLSIARVDSRHGTWASCIALRFEGGERTFSRRGRTWEWPEIRVDGNEKLYCITFTVPRFLDLPMREKLDTVVHELCHISPRFDGSLRRFGEGRHAHHGSSREWYDRVMVKPLVEAALPHIDLAAWPFLTQNVRELKESYGRVHGTVAKRLRPRLVRA